MSIGGQEALNVYLFSVVHVSATECGDQVLVRYAKIDKALKEARIDAATSILYFSMPDKDGSGSIGQDEAKRYLDDSGLTPAQKSYLFALTNSQWKSNLYK